MCRCIRPIKSNANDRNSIIHIALWNYAVRSSKHYGYSLSFILCKNVYYIVFSIPFWLDMSPGWMVTGNQDISQEKNQSFFFVSNCGLCCHIDYYVAEDEIHIAVHSLSGTQGYFLCGQQNKLEIISVTFSLSFRLYLACIIYPSSFFNELNRILMGCNIISFNWLVLQCYCNLIKSQPLICNPMNKKIDGKKITTSVLAKFH